MKFARSAPSWACRASCWRGIRSPGRVWPSAAIVRRLSEDSGFADTIWQFPVVLIPLGTGADPDSVVLRPVDSVDGMTAQSAPIPAPLLQSLASEILPLSGVSCVFYDLTHKP